MGEKHKDIRGRSSKYWRASQDRFGQTKAKPPTVFPPDSELHFLHSLFIAFATFLLITFLPHEPCRNI